MSFQFFNFAGAPVFEAEMRARFTVHDFGVIGSAHLHFGEIDARKPAVLVEINGEAAMVVADDFMEPAPANWSDGDE